MQSCVRFHRHKAKFHKKNHLTTWKCSWHLILASGWVFMENPTWQELLLFPCIIHSLFLTTKYCIGILPSNKSIRIWLRHGDLAQRFCLSMKLYSPWMRPTFPSLKMGYCYRIACASLQSDWGAAGITEGREYAMRKTFWQTISAKPDGRYYRL